jgi:hypothetical protein
VGCNDGVERVKILIDAQVPSNIDAIVTLIMSAYWFKNEGNTLL